MDDDNIVEFKPGNTKPDESKNRVAQPHWEVEPWHEPTKPNELVEAIVARIKRRVVLSDGAALTVALWILVGT
jgi:hypothetical protein